MVLPKNLNRPTSKLKYTDLEEILIKFASGQIENMAEANYNILFRLLLVGVMSKSMFSSMQKKIKLIKYHDEVIARWISHVISPHIVGIVITAVVALKYGDNPLEMIGWLLILVPIVVLPPLFYLLWLVHIGKLTDIYMPDRSTRLRPLTAMMAWILFCLLLIRYWQAPIIVEAFFMSAFVLIGILSLVTLFWKISFHGATISAVATATVMMAGSWAWPVLLLVPLVGWSRIRLERHTPRQVVYGSLVGALMGLILVYGLVLNLL